MAPGEGREGTGGKEGREGKGREREREGREREGVGKGREGVVSVIAIGGIDAPARTQP